jgi:hypothetical protein
MLLVILRCRNKLVIISSSLVNYTIKIIIRKSVIYCSSMSHVLHYFIKPRFHDITEQRGINDFVSRSLKMIWRLLTFEGIIMLSVDVLLLTGYDGYQLEMTCNVSGDL